MKPLFLVRLVLDLVAVCLLIIALAYYSFNNLTHELIGTGIFLLLAAHNLFNRRWWAGIGRGRRDARSVATKSLNLSLLVTMLTLLATSIVISQAVFSFLPIASTSTTRQLHSATAYWALLVVGVHLGWHWSMVMGIAGNHLSLGAANASRAFALRFTAAVGSMFGVYAFQQEGLFSKLLMQVSSDFAAPPDALLIRTLNHAAVVWLVACVAHYGSRLVSRRSA